MRLVTLKRSAEFKRVRGGLRVAGRLLVVEAKLREASPATAPGANVPRSNDPRFGFTITRKIGGAVVRNRIRRRLKEALRGLEPGLVEAAYDYVLVARGEAKDATFDALRSELKGALARLHRRGGHGAQRSRDAPADGPQPARPAGEREGHEPQRGDTRPAGRS